MSTTSATVETLTAEVRVLMVGNRQVTLSVYRQLDTVLSGEIDPFGRVRDSKDEGALNVVGRALPSRRRAAPAIGSLVRAAIGQRFGARTTPPAGWLERSSGLRETDGPTSYRFQAVIAESHGGDIADAIRWDMYGAYVDRPGPDWQVTFSSPEMRERCLAIAQADLVANAAERARYDEWADLPLIVLAGLR